MLQDAGTTVAELFAICSQHFGRFIDLGKNVEGARSRRTAELQEALSYLGNDEQTDIVLFNVSPGARIDSEHE
jgi:hypothetical protein